MLEEVAKAQRKELVRAGTRLVKSGVAPTGKPPEGRTLTRAEQRQAQRALGYRGSKAKRHNFQRQQAKLRQVLTVEEVLDAAQDRIDHPVRSRLRRK